MHPAASNDHNAQGEAVSGRRSSHRTTPITDVSVPLLYTINADLSISFLRGDGLAKKCDQKDAQAGAKEKSQQKQQHVAQEGSQATGLLLLDYAA